ncbi:cytochrome P450 [Penicillium taxi]|uniref:cytochrome P450 n=1 Tax=Penicillium taxi TaxID=168475 RepID=UPI0025459E25|nr:cytochrome P450 [Penicillium taxi]KAJ5908820.1 cytochrome P450 [Penicillium taxi]
MSSLGTSITNRIERMHNAENSTDFVHGMMTDQRDGKIDHDTIKRNALIVILSGIETIPDYICSVLFYTLETPEYFVRLREEITSTFRSSREISATSVQDLKFLKSCMHESLRLAPPFVGTLPRRVPTSTPGVTICNRFVPSGTTVGIHNWSITHSPQFWIDPEKFRPDRWMGDSRYTGDIREAFHPFGFGPRTCVARNLVIIEASFILARLLFEFDMQLDSQGWKWPIRNGHLVPVKGPLFVKIMPRTCESTTMEP